MIPQALNFSFSDCEGFNDLLKHDDVEITQVQPGRFANSVSLIPLEHMVFRYGRKATPWISTGTAEPGHISLLVDLNYRILPTVNGLRQEGRPFVQLYGGGAEHCTVAHDPGEFAFVPIPIPVLEQALHRLGIDVLPVRSGRMTAIHADDETFRQLNDTFQGLRTSAENTPELFLSQEVRRTVERELLTRLALVIERAGPASGNNHQPQKVRMSVLRNAREFLDARAHTPVYLAELCGAVGVPERTLRDTFQTMLGVSPLKYLQLRRMRQARATLQQADKGSHSVKSIALDNGFWELGRFAVEYKRLFGESPSETLAASSR